MVESPQLVGFNLLAIKVLFWLKSGLVEQAIYLPIQIDLLLHREYGATFVRAKDSLQVHVINRFSLHEVVIDPVQLL